MIITRTLLVIASAATLLTSGFSVAQTTESPASTAASISLLDKDLSQFEIWMGVPHSSVTGLPDGTPTSDDCHSGVPMGLGADVKHVYSMTEDQGEPILRISGEIFGGLTTKNEYENYHLSLKIKWGEKKWAPRLKMLRDNGILYHCHGEHGATWEVWKSSLEFQVQETDLGDFIPVAGPTAKIRTKKIKDVDRLRFDPDSDQYNNGHVSAFPETDKPHGQWNQLDLYTLGDTSVHVVNGTVVMVIEEAAKADGTPLTRGQIQIQSEAAECYYKQIQLSPITGFPDAIASQLRLQAGSR